MVELTEAVSRLEPAPLSLETLQRGAENINTGHPLSEIIKFLKELGVWVEISRRLPEKQFSIVSSTPLSRSYEEDRRISDQTIFITNLLGKPELRASGARQRNRPLGFVVVIPLEEKDGSETAKKAYLYSGFSMAKIRTLINKTIGGIPPHWQFQKRPRSHHLTLVK